MNLKIKITRDGFIQKTEYYHKDEIGEVVKILSHLDKIYLITILTQLTEKKPVFKKIELGSGDYEIISEEEYWCKVKVIKDYQAKGIRFWHETKKIKSEG